MQKYNTKAFREGISIAVIIAGFLHWFGIPEYTSIILLLVYWTLWVKS